MTTLALVGVLVLVLVLGLGAVRGGEEAISFGFVFVPFFLIPVFLFGLAYLVSLVSLDDVLDFLGEVVVGVVFGGVGVGVGFLLILVVVGIVSEVGARRAAQVPEHLRAVPAQAPKTLRWVRGLLPGDEGAAWLAEVASCLAEAHDKRERRRYVRSYRRGVPQLIWTSWTAQLSASRSRELS